MFAELISAPARTRAIGLAQEALNRSLSEDREFARRELLLPHHARLGEWIDGTIGRRVLELGCGSGRYVGMLACLGFEVNGVDPFDFPSWDRLRRFQNVKLRTGVRAEHLPFEDGSFDYVCCLGALLYFDDPEKALSEMHRVLKPGGRAVLRSVNRTNLYTRRTGRSLDPVAKNLYSLDEMLALTVAAGFEPVEAFQFGYYPSRFKDLYWYLANVRFSRATELRLSERLAPVSRINNILHLLRH